MIKTIGYSMVLILCVQVHMAQAGKTNREGDEEYTPRAGRKRHAWEREDKESEDQSPPKAATKRIKVTEDEEKDLEKKGSGDVPTPPSPKDLLEEKGPVIEKKRNKKDKEKDRGIRRGGMSVCPGFFNTKLRAQCEWC